MTTFPPLDPAGLTAEELDIAIEVFDGLLDDLLGVLHQQPRDGRFRAYVDRLFDALVESRGAALKELRGRVPETRNAALARARALVRADLDHDNVGGALRHLAEVADFPPVESPEVYRELLRERIERLAAVRDMERA